MNLVDVIIVILLVITIVRGIEIGFIRQAASLIGLVAGVFIGSSIASFFNVSAAIQTAIVLSSVILLVIAAELIGIRIKLRVTASRINHADKSMGAAMGIATCLAIVWLGSTIVSGISAPDLQRSVRDSRIIAWLDRTLPPATDVLAHLEQSFQNTGLPELFSNIEPELRPTGATLPNLAEFDRVVAQAKPSVVEIEGRSCQGIGVGSGFVADNDLVLTNAHVVAGMRTPYVRDDNGRRNASIVAFDPELDIAVLRAENLAGSPLPLQNDRVPVGTSGVVLGYPEGGPFVAKPARIVELFTALGTDIYDDVLSKRETYALRADIQPGNSGGPILDTDGNVIGVIYARSTAYQGVGYAVTTPSVLDLLEQALSSPSAGSSDRCL